MMRNGCVLLVLSGLCFLAAAWSAAVTARSLAALLGIPFLMALAIVVGIAAFVVAAGYPRFERWMNRRWPR